MAIGNAPFAYVQQLLMSLTLSYCLYLYCADQMVQKEYIWNKSNGRKFRKMVKLNENINKPMNIYLKHFNKYGMI